MPFECPHCHGPVDKRGACHCNEWPVTCPICNGQLTWTHDHRADNSGLDDGPPLYHVRKNPEPKSADEVRAIRAAAWATRRQKYGPHGHR